MTWGLRFKDTMEMRVVNTRSPLLTCTQWAVFYLGPREGPGLTRRGMGDLRPTSGLKFFIERVSNLIGFGAWLLVYFLPP